MMTEKHTKIEELIKACEIAIESSEKSIQEFQKRLTENPADALAWSSKTFVAAAKLSVHRDLKNLAEHLFKNGTESDAAMEVLREYAMEKTLSYAREVPSSTSPVSNLMENRLREAWAGTVTGWNCILK